MAATKPRGILALPDEILQEILELVIDTSTDLPDRYEKAYYALGAKPDRQAAWRLTQVCSRFHPLAAPRMFDEKLTFGKKPDRIRAELERLTGNAMLHKAVRWLSLLRNDDKRPIEHLDDPVAAYDTMIRFMASCSRLTHLEIGDVESDPDRTDSPFKAWLPERGGQFVFFPDRWEKHVGVVRMPTVRSVKVADTLARIDDYARLFRGGGSASIFPNLEELCLSIWVHQYWDERMADVLIEILKAHPRLRRLRLVPGSHWYQHWRVDDFVRPMIRPLHKLCSFVPDPVEEGKPQQLEYLCIVVYSVQEGEHRVRATEMLDRLLESLTDVAIRGDVRHRLVKYQGKREARSEAPTTERGIEDPQDQLRRTGIMFQLVPFINHRSGMRYWLDGNEKMMWERAATDPSYDLFCPVW